MEIKVQLIGKTAPLIEGVTSVSEFITYMAKISNPDKQFEGLSTGRLIKYLIANSHWSPLEMCDFIVEIQAPRDISRQILRHTSARFQEFSQRYAEVSNFTIREIREQDSKNRQSSLDTFSEDDKQEFEQDCKIHIEESNNLYQKWLKRGGAKECARVFLPEGLTMSRLYMKAPVRTWIHYLDLREGNGTQKEHVLVANRIREVLKQEEPELF